jgi:hypothetical protein
MFSSGLVVIAIWTSPRTNFVEGGVIVKSPLL